MTTFIKGHANLLAKNERIKVEGYYFIDQDRHLFVHRSLGDPKSWNVSEPSTGKWIYSCSTRKSAIDETLKRLNSYNMFGDKWKNHLKNELAS